MEMTLARGMVLTQNESSKAPAVDADEVTLVNRSVDRDEKAYGMLVQRYQVRLFNFVRSMVRNQELAEDLTQESFVKAYFSLHRLQNPASFKSWLFRIANNNTLDYLRKKRLPQVDVDEHIRESYVDVASPEKKHVAESRSEHIRNALGKLKPDQRSILVMCDLQGLSYAEISAALNIPFGTVQSRIFYARKKLKNHLDKSILFGAEK